MNHRMYRYHEDQNRFVPVADYGAQFGLSGLLVQPAVARSTGASPWFWAKKTREKSWQLKRALREPAGNYRVQHFDLGGTTDPLKHFFYEQPGRAAWFCGIDGLVRFGYPQAGNHSGSFLAVLENVVLSPDSVLYPGSREKTELPYGLNSLRFQCAATSYNGADHNKFGYWLEGFEDGWSAWTAAPLKNTPNCRRACTPFTSGPSTPRANRASRPGIPLPSCRRGTGPGSCTWYTCCWGPAPCTASCVGVRPAWKRKKPSWKP
jgi:hypothetical protein